MAERLNIKDTVQEWISKINDTLDLNTVDGNFRVESQSGFNITISSGKIRSGSNLVEVPSKQLTLTANKTYFIGANTNTNILEAYVQAGLPSQDFIPIWLVKTNNVEISSVEDFRTWAFDDAGIAEEAIAAHVAESDPHEQYVLESQLGSSASGEGASIVSMEGGPSVEQAVNERTIYVGSVAELEALSLAAGVNVYLTEDGRAGGGVIKSGTPPTDPQKGVIIILANGNYWERQYGQKATMWASVKGEWFGADPSGVEDSYPAISGALLFATEVTLSAGTFRSDTTIQINAGKSLFLEGGAILRRTSDSTNTDPVVWVRGAAASLQGRGQAVTTISTQNRAPDGIIKIGQADMLTSDTNITYCTVGGFTLEGSVNNGQTSGSPDIGIHMPSPQIGGFVNYFHNISNIRILDTNIGIWLRGFANALTIHSIQGQRIGNTTLSANQEDRSFIRVSGALDNNIWGCFFTQSTDSVGLFYEELDNTGVAGGSLHIPGENSFRGLIFEQGGGSAQAIYATTNGNNSYFEIKDNVSGGSTLPAGFTEENLVFFRAASNYQLARAGREQSEFIHKDQNFDSNATYEKGFKFSNLLEDESYNLADIQVALSFDSCLVEVSFKMRTGLGITGGAYKLIGRIDRDGSNNYSLTVLEYKAAGLGDLCQLQGRNLVYRNFNNGTASTNAFIEGTIKAYGASAITIPSAATVASSAGTVLTRT